MKRIGTWFDYNYNLMNRKYGVGYLLIIVNLSSKSSSNTVIPVGIKSILILVFIPKRH